MSVVKFLVSGFWFAIAAFVALASANYGGFYMSGLFDGITGRVFYAWDLFSVAPLLASFVVGGFFGDKLLSEKEKSTKEVIWLGVRVPIIAALLTILVVVGFMGFYSLFSPYPTGLNILARFGMAIYSTISLAVMATLIVLLPLSPIITPFGVVAALLLRYGFTSYTKRGA